ncbi:hypothetical protein G6F70_000958 [Rhizopus microsporus]|nr:hypothetical protein G6F71_001744 [Rhizopus microsporus]KAG1203873.1 hypothetical protein G6F70_000958 [Rhizopus microsporus]KAG1214738.1 hypothetical protein G6F69_001629 [Rhizopus microsporus]
MELKRRELRRVVRADHRTTLKEISQIISTKASVNTIRNELKKIGYASRVAVEKPFLNEQHQKASIEIGKLSSQPRVWWKMLEKFKKKCLAPSFKGGRTSIIVWGAMADGKKSKLVFMKKGMRTSEDFINQVYEPVLIDFCKSLDSPVLMEDGAPIHRAKIAAEWREAKGINKMPWTAQSPDLNLIESLWSMLRKRVSALCPHAKSPQVMEVVLESAWMEFTPETINKLIDSIPKKVKDVIKARGGPTKY